jgi:hypothetical protein
MSDDYAARQAARDREYLAAFDTPEARAWIANMPADERRRLEAEGLLKPLVPGTGNGLRDEDLAESSLASETPDIAAAVDREPTPPEQASTAAADVLGAFCARLRGRPNPALVFDALCYAAGVSALEGLSATDLAARHGVSKQAFSKIAVEWTQTLGLPPARAMKSKKARAVYRERAKKDHARRKLTLRGLA